MSSTFPELLLRAENNSTTVTTVLVLMAVAVGRADTTLMNT